MRARSCRRIGADGGAALVELVVALPVLLVVLIGTADFGRVFYLAIELTNAARAGAQYGATNRGTSGDIAGMEAVARGSVNIAGINATASRLCQCAMADGSFPDTVLCEADPATACPTPKFRVITVTVTTSKTFNTISPYPGIPNSLNISRMSVMRVTE